MSLIYPTSSSQNDKLRRTCHKEIAGGVIPHNHAEVETYLLTRAALLDREVQNKILNSGDQNLIDDFMFNFGSQTATYTDPKGIKREIDLTSIKDSKVRSALFQLYHATNAWDQCRVKVRASSKGKLNGEPPFQRKTRALQSLPSKFDDNYYKKELPKALKKFQAPEAKKAIVDRLLFAEKYINDLTTQLKNKQKGRREHLSKATDNVHKQALGKEIQELNHLIQTLENLDTYPLQKALTTLPIGPISEEHLYALANQLAHEVHEEIKGNKWGYFDLIKGSSTKEEIEFVNDVAGSLFLGRGAYFGFCERAKIQPKQEAPSDLFLRTALRYALEKADPSKSSQRFYPVEKEEGNILLKDFSKALREEVLDEMHECGVLAKNAMSQSSNKGYEEAKDDEGKLKEAIVTQRKQIDAKLTIDQLKTEGKMYDRSSASHAFSDAIVPYVGAAFLPLALRGVYEWSNGISARDIVPRVIQSVFNCPAPYFVASQVIPSLITDPKSKAISWNKVGTITAVGLGIYLLAQYASFDPTVEETWTFTAAGWGVWAANQYFKGYMLNGFRKGISYMIPERAKKKASELGQEVVAKFPENIQPVVRGGGNLLLGLGSLWAFNTITSSYAPDYETVASAASWTWDNVAPNMLKKMFKSMIV